MAKEIVPKKGPPKALGQRVLALETKLEVVARTVSGILFALQDKGGRGMHRFPVELPLPDIMVVIDYVRGRSTLPIGDVAEAAWWVSGFALGKVLPGAAGDVGEVDVAAILEDISARGALPLDRSLPWLQIVMFILELLSKLLSGEAPPSA